VAMTKKGKGPWQLLGRRIKSGSLGSLLGKREKKGSVGYSLAGG
jgi:hypothetical protein